MSIFETLFDFTYLFLVISLGIRLLIVKDKNAGIFGTMAVILGLGDGFHLLPRILSYWGEGGFEAHSAMLSYGEMVTSITMTVFYIFYYHYYENVTGDKSKNKKMTVYVLSILRIVLTVLPQNGWGNMPGNYTFAVLRNIPFFILGLLLVVWSYKKKDKDIMKKSAYLIAGSFICYAPVVLFAQIIPAVGALMIPKTVCYLLIVFEGFKKYIPKFRLQSMAELSFTSLVMGLAGGVFYREFTKFYGFTSVTRLSKLHLHIIVLGFVSMFVCYMAAMMFVGENNYSKYFKRGVYLWTSGLFVTNLIFMTRGIMDVLGTKLSFALDKSISGIAGIGHIMLGVGLCMVVYIIISIAGKKTENI